MRYSTLSVPVRDPHATRYGISLGPAMLVTFALFWTMQALVSQVYEVAIAKPAPAISIVRLIRDTPPHVEPREKPPLVKPKHAPPPPVLTSNTKLKPGDAIAALERELDPGQALKDAGRQAGSDRGLVALVRPDPEYPASAQARGIGGWVRIEFTVTKIGAVADVRVVASHPERIFDSAALSAIRRWRYNPRVSNGEVVDTPGVQVVLQFQP